MSGVGLLPQSASIRWSTTLPPLKLNTEVQHGTIQLGGTLITLCAEGLDSKLSGSEFIAVFSTTVCGPFKMFIVQSNFA